MTLPVVYSSSCLADLYGIWTYHAEHSVETADRMVTAINDRIDGLSRFPLIGERQPRFGPRTRRTLCRGYVIYYEVADDRVDVLRVVHGARDTTSLRLD
ncbi:MAG: type II toxin-antitoxin system RelE/ParE family toxin [Lacipirellulaceae bacterium]